MELPPWAVEAREVPLLFSQVREDAQGDLDVVAALRPGARVLMVASGGCTAAALASSAGLSRLHLVDPNPVQLHLARLKLTLAGRPRRERLELLGHTPMDPANRRHSLSQALHTAGLTDDALGVSMDVLAAEGPDRVGRYERTFAALRAALPQEVSPLLDRALRAEGPAGDLIALGTPLGDAIDAAFRDVFALPILVALFGEGATANRVQDFSQHFAERTRAVFSALPPATNPYLWQVLAGRYPETLTPWLEAEPTSKLPPVTWDDAPMNDALERADGPFDFVHLSNILDWLEPAQAAQTLELAWRQLAPGGAILVRQLNSTLDVRAAGPQVTWDPQRSAALLAKDRSYFYRQLHLGRRPR